MAPSKSVRRAAALAFGTAAIAAPVATAKKPETLGKGDTRAVAPSGYNKLVFPETAAPDAYGFSAKPGKSILYVGKATRVDKAAKLGSSTAGDRPAVAGQAKITVPADFGTHPGDKITLGLTSMNHKLADQHLGGASEVPTGPREGTKDILVTQALELADAGKGSYDLGLEYSGTYNGQAVAWIGAAGLKLHVGPHHSLSVTSTAEQGVEPSIQGF